MSRSVPSPLGLHDAAEQLADVPVVRWAERWWLVALSGMVPSDPALSHDLNRHAADMRAANRAVTESGAEPE